MTKAQESVLHAYHAWSEQKGRPGLNEQIWWFVSDKLGFLLKMLISIARKTELKNKRVEVGSIWSQGAAFEVLKCLL